MRYVRGFKVAALAAVLYVVFLPLFARSQLNFGITPGLFVAGVIFVSYAILGARGLALSQKEKARRFDLIDILLLGAFPLYLIYFGNGRFLSSLDTSATRQLPLAILQKGTMNLAGQKIFSGNTEHYELVEIDGEKLSAFPIGTAFLAVPHTAIALAASGTDGSGERSLLWEKHFSALFAVFSVLALFFALRERYEESIAAKTSIVFALATGMLSCASQAMWSFTGEIFFLTIAVFLFVKHFPLLAGCAAGGAFLCRPTAIIFVAIAGILLYRTDRRNGNRFIAASLISIAGAMILLFVHYGHPLGGYGMINAANSAWNSNFLVALLGNCISPSRGFLLFFPFVIPCLFILVQSRSIDQVTAASILCTPAVILVTSVYTKWWGGHSLGPRLLTETSLFIAVLTIPLWRKSGWIKAVFVVLLLFSICTQLLMVYNPSVSEWSSAVQIDAHPEMLWVWEKSQLAVAWSW